MATTYIKILCLVLSLILGTHGSKCRSDCHYTQSFDEPLALSEKCVKTKSDFLCQVRIIVDYSTKTFSVRFGSRIDDRKRAIDDKYDYIQEVTKINATQLVKNLFYSCTLGDECEAKFLEERLSKLLKKDYTQMQNSLMDIIGGPASTSLTCMQGYSTPMPTKCNETCLGERNQFIHLNTGALIPLNDAPRCEKATIVPEITIVATKIPQGQAILSTRQIWYTCSKNLCNSQEITDRIESIINKSYTAYYQ